jgi:hypothetical protein
VTYLEIVTTSTLTTLYCSKIKIVSKSFRYLVLESGIPEYRVAQ